MWWYFACDRSSLNIKRIRVEMKCTRNKIVSAGHSLLNPFLEIVKRQKKKKTVTLQTEFRLKVGFSPITLAVCTSEQITSKWTWRDAIYPLGTVHKSRYSQTGSYPTPSQVLQMTFIFSLKRVIEFSAMVPLLNHPRCKKQF